MLDILRPFLSRIAALLVIWLVVVVLAQFGWHTAIMILTFMPEISTVLAIYALSHKIIDKYVNPLDTATTQSAKETAGAP